MKHLLLAMLLIPAFASAGIPLVAPVSAGNLTPLDGRTFSSSVMVQMAGDEIAVLDPVDNSFGTGHGSVYLFAKQAGGWQQTAKFDPPGGTEGAFRGLSFHDDVMVVSIKPSIESLDGARYRSYVLERVNGAWMQSFVLPDRVTGPVKIRGNWMAVPRRKGIEMFQHLGFGSWQSAGELAQEGFSYLFEAFAGPGYDFDGRRILISSDATVSAPEGNPWSYFNVAARLYQLDGNNQWVLTTRLPTPESFSNLNVNPEATSLSGSDASVLGHVFRDDGYGYWEVTANLSPVSSSLLERMQVELLGNGMAWVTVPNSDRRDLYLSDAYGYWQPRLRLAPGSPTILATLGALSVAAQITPASNPRLPGTAVLSLVDLAATSARAQPPARFSNIDVTAASVAVGGDSGISTKVYVGSGVTVATVEYRVGAGPWQPMNAGDGAFDEDFEMAWVLRQFPDQIFGNASICLRVTDSLGRQTELLDRQGEPCPIIVGRTEPLYPIRIPDVEPPVVEMPMLASTQIQFGQDNVIYAFADDSGSGEICTGQFNCSSTSLIAMQFRIDDGVWRAMKTFPQFAPGPFLIGGEMSAAQGIFPPATTPGLHSACVRAIDSLGNVSVPQCVSYEVAP